MKPTEFCVVADRSKVDTFPFSAVMRGGGWQKRGASYRGSADDMENKILTAQYDIIFIFNSCVSAANFVLKFKMFNSFIFAC